MFSDKFYLMTSIEDLGRFATTRGMPDGAIIPLERGFQQLSVNMQGLIQPDIPQKPSVRARAIKSCAALLTGPMRTVRNPWRALKQGMNRTFVKNSGASLQNTYRRQMRAHALTTASVDALLETHEKLV